MNINKSLIGDFAKYTLIGAAQGTAVFLMAVGAVVVVDAIMSSHEVVDGVVDTVA